MKDADSTGRLKSGGATPKRDGPTLPVDDNPEKPAAPGSDRHRANQRELGVDEDHRTDDMVREHRGTFP